ncbi:MAG: glycosyltransferase [Flavobacteriales bacterium]|nr:glycosyltransferase [Flavobacteriales bacterium]
MKISVLTPCYRSGAFLEQAIQSVLAQKDPDFEHIVVDGGSDDETVSILKKHSHLTWISEPDDGQSDAMNKAFGLSAGDVIVYLNADDTFEPGAFQLIREAWKKDPDADMFVGDLLLVRPDKQVRIQPTVVYLELLLFYRKRFPYNPVSYFYKRQVQQQIGPFPKAKHHTMDFWFLLNAYQRFRIRKLDGVLGSFHMHEANKTSLVDSNILCLKSAINHCLKHDPGKLPFLLRHWVVFRYFGGSRKHRPEV